jgi:hypothetical protein
MVQVPITARNSAERSPVGNERLRYTAPRDIVGPAMQRAGQALGAAANDLAEADTIRAEEEALRLDVELMSGARQLRQRVLSARGIQARTALTEAEEEFRTLSEGILERTTSRLARRRMTRLIAERTEQNLSTWADHARVQETQAVVAGHEARITSLVETAIDEAETPNGVINLGAAIDEARQLGRINGWSEAQTDNQLLTVRSQFHRGRAWRRFEAGDPEGAQRILDENRGEMTTEDEATVRRLIRSDLEANETERLGREVLGGMGTPAETGGQPPAPTTGTAGEIATGLRAGRVAGRQLSEAVVAGILGNGEVEAAFDSGRTGDGGTAFGHFQWRAERVANFQRVIGRHPRGATGAQSARFVLWELNNPREAGMTIAQRDAILNADTPEEAAALFDRHYERSNGQHRERRTAAARRFAGGVPATPDGTRVDLAEAYRRIDERTDLNDSQRRRLRDWVRGQATLNDQITARRETDADREIGQALDGIARGGGRLTSLSQLPQSALAGASPGTITRLQASIEANNQRAEPDANGPLMAELVIQAATNPNAFARVEPEMYRGRVTDAEVEQLHRMRLGITQRAGPQPSAILSVINFVLPETGLLPAVPTDGDADDRRAATQRREQTQQQIRARLLSSVQERLRRTHGQEEITQAHILSAVRAEVTQVTVGGRQMRVFEAREAGASQYGVAIPNAAIPEINEALRRAGLPQTPNNRVQFYLRNRDQIDRAVGRIVGAGSGVAE